MTRRFEFLANVFGRAKLLERLRERQPHSPSLIRQRRRALLTTDFTRELVFGRVLGVVVELERVHARDEEQGAFGKDARPLVRRALEDLTCVTMAEGRIDGKFVVDDVLNTSTVTRGVIGDGFVLLLDVGIRRTGSPIGRHLKFETRAHRRQWRFLRTK